MKKLKIAVIDLVSKGPTKALYARVMNPNLTSIMPQVVSVWCEEAGHDVKFVCYTGFENLLEEIPQETDIVFVTSFTQAAAGALLFVGSLASISVRIVVGAITDRIGGRGFTGVAILLGTGALVFLLLRPATGLAFGVLVVFAFATAWGWTGLMTFTVVNANTSTVAASSAIMQAGIFLGAGLGPILLGWTIDQYSLPEPLRR